jgi:hypothetical protein
VSFFAATALALCGCGEETYKVHRGTDELAKPKDSKAASRIEKAQKAEEEIFKQSKKLR